MIADWYDTEQGSTTLVDGYAATVLAAEEPGGAILWWTVTVTATQQASRPGFRWVSSASSRDAAKAAALVTLRSLATVQGVVA